MSNIHTLPNQDERFDQASLWIAKLEKGLPDDEREALRQWLGEHSENAKLLSRMAGLWDRMDALSRLADLFPASREERAALRPWLIPAVAAGVVCTMLAGLWALQLRNNPAAVQTPAVVQASAQFEVYETAVGEHSTVILDDGSEVVLNTNSRLEVYFSAEHRLLKLERGELIIRVAKEKTRPLSVLVGQQVVQAVGTEFNLEITSDQRIELVVTEGKVHVGIHNTLDRPLEVQRPNLFSQSTVEVSEGETLMLGSTDEEVHRLEPDDIKVKLSWRNGNLIFRGESLEDAVTEIERYTSVEFIFLDEDLKKVRIAGLFKAGDVDGLLAALRENFDISNEKTSEGRVLLGKQ